MTDRSDQPAESGPRASIVIVAASAGPLLRGCLESLASVRPAVDHETIVVLNGAGPRDAAEIRELGSGVRVAHSAVNLGLAAAVNVGRSHARGEFVVLLHDDAEVRVGWLEGLVSAADGDPGAGAVGSVVLDREGRVTAAGWQLLPDGTTQPPWSGDPPAAAALGGVRSVDYCGTCSLLVRAATWDRVGGADETLYPVYYVDVDLCLGIRARGERVLCAPESVVTHFGGASTTRDFALFATARNRVRLREKWGSVLSTHVPGSGATFTLDPADLPVQGREADPVGRERQTAGEFAEDQRRRLARCSAELTDALERAAAADAGRDALAARLDDSRRELHAGDVARAVLEAEAAAARAVLEAEAAAARAVLEADVAAARAVLEADVAEQSRRADTAEERLGRLETDHALLVREAAWLRRQAETLALVEAGGWWRLRTRVRPVLLAARAAERHVRRLLR